MSPSFSTFMYACAADHLMHAARECHNIYKKINYTYGGKVS